MTQIIKKGTKKEKPKLHKDIIVTLGKRLYEFDDVKSIAIYIEFKDGSGMKFRRGEED